MSIAKAASDDLAAESAAHASESGTHRPASMTSGTIASGLAPSNDRTVFVLAALARPNPIARTKLPADRNFG